MEETGLLWGAADTHVAAKATTLTNVDKSFISLFLPHVTLGTGVACIEESPGGMSPHKSIPLSIPLRLKNEMPDS